MIWKYFAGTKAGDKEVLKESQTVISCDFTGLLSKLDSVSWKKPNGDVITTEMTDYVIAEGDYKADTKTQTTTLTVAAAANVADFTYTCVVTSDEWEISNRENNVILETFCKFSIYCWFNNFLYFTS